MILMLVGCGDQSITHEIVIDPTSWFHSLDQARDRALAPALHMINNTPAPTTHAITGDAPVIMSQDHRIEHTRE